MGEGSRSFEALLPPPQEKCFCPWKGLLPKEEKIGKEKGEKTIAATMSDGFWVKKKGERAKTGKGAFQGTGGNPAKVENKKKATRKSVKDYQPGDPH